MDGDGSRTRVRENGYRGVQAQKEALEKWCLLNPIIEQISKVFIVAWSSAWGKRKFVVEVLLPKMYIYLWQPNRVSLIWGQHNRTRTQSAYLTPQGQNCKESLSFYYRSPETPFVELKIPFRGLPNYTTDSAKDTWHSARADLAQVPQAVT